MENQPKPKNYLVESILVTIFCCLIFGILGIINASKVNSEYEKGNYDAAAKASADAKKWVIWAVISWVILAIIYAILFFAGFVAGFSGL
ncbi:MAG: hypothetical protein Aureis2KO_11980 [Aureisphaera sp.]